MPKTFTSSYSIAQQSLITSLVQTVNPSFVLEIGTQQGSSSIALGKGMSSDSKLITYDLFEESYEDYPYFSTHANKKLAEQNLKKANLLCDWEVRKGNYKHFLLQEQEVVDILHVDICNHLGNLSPILRFCESKVTSMIILEGGGHNDWQRKHKFVPYKSSLNQNYLCNWEHVTIYEGSHRAITIMSRRKNDSSF